MLNPPENHFLQKKGKPVFLMAERKRFTQHMLVNPEVRIDDLLWRLQTKCQLCHVSRHETSHGIYMEVRGKSYAPRVTLTYNPIEPITIAFVQSYGGDQVEATLDAWDETRKVLDECGD